MRTIIMVGLFGICFMLSVRADTPAFNSAVRVGTNQAAVINECSGLVASRQYPGVLWVHNDSGDSARIFAINPQGALLGTYNLSGISATDWEDISLSTDPLDGKDYVYVADIGDNYAGRSSIRVYRVLEPVVDTNQFNVSSNLSGVETYTFTYPGGARDAESLLTDPWSGDFYILSKRTNNAEIYRAPYPQATNVTTSLIKTGEMTIGWTVGADLSPSGRQLLIKQYSAIYYLSRVSGEALEHVLTNSPTAVPCVTEPQGEAVTWEAGESGYFTLSEGTSQPIYYYTSQDTDGDKLVDSLEVVWSTEMNESDTDGDGQVDGDEVIAGVSPTNAESYFTIDVALSSIEGMTLEWVARTNRIYSIQKCSGPFSNSADFVPVASNIMVTVDQTYSTNMMLDSETSTFRICVRRE